MRGRDLDIEVELLKLRAAIEHGWAILNHVKFLGYENCAGALP
jgi:hypothetical protein